jgi:hypothetical protein
MEEEAEGPEVSKPALRGLAAHTGTCNWRECGTARKGDVPSRSGDIEPQAERSD